MREWVELALHAATARGAFLAGARAVECREQTVRIKDGEVDALRGTETVGRRARRVWFNPGIAGAPALKLSIIDSTS